MIINHIDHIVLTTRDIKACTDFYTRVLGMELFIFGENRTAFLFGQQKINVHEYGKELEPKAHLPVPGSLDLCFIVAGTIDVMIDQLQKTGIVIIEEPVRRTGACGAIMSCYIRDPDLNLIELSCYI